MSDLLTRLMPHQVAAVDKLIGLKVGALFAEQGTGKSLTVMEIARRRLERDKIDHIIWLCPCSAKYNIKHEILRHCPDDMLDKFTICGIETMSSSVNALSYLLSLADSKRCFLVVDESLLIKNPKAKRTQHIQMVADKCTYRIILNGTPISRNEADLFSQFYLLDWRILGYRSYYGFASNHIEYDATGRIRRVLDIDSISSKISPYTFQIRRSECIELPPKRYNTQYFRLTNEQQDHYEYIADAMMMLLDEMRPETVYRLLSGLRAVISGKRVLIRSSHHFDTTEFFEDPLDNPRIQEVIDVLPKSEKAIVYCEYDSEISHLCSILGDNAVRFDGQVSVKNRNRNLDKFKGDAQYLIANKQCAGYSLNLQFCRNIIYMSNNWDLGPRLQSEDRIHRIGQTHQVSITDICCLDTLDEAMLACISRKNSVLNSIKRSIRNKDMLNAIVHGAHDLKGAILDAD